jgi:hypothetical protein
VLLCAPYVFADDHEGGEMPPEGDMPQLMLAPPPETEKPDDVGEPPPEDGPEALVDWLTPIFHGMMDTDGSGELSLEELRAWAVHAHVPPPMPPEGDMPPEGEMMGLSKDAPELADLPDAPECDDGLRDSELLPQAENVPCTHSESEGNLLFRTICNMPPYDSVAISLPGDLDNRAADCFSIEALTGFVVFGIFNEADGALMWDVSMGKEAYQNLVLTPGTYQIKMLDGSSADAAVTVSFIGHPMF